MEMEVGDRPLASAKGGAFLLIFQRGQIHAETA